MTALTVDPTCPLPVPADAAARPVGVHTGTACLAVMDTEHVATVWEDLLYDGHDHDHGAGGLMLNTGSVGTHLEYDGEFPVQVHRDGDGAVVAVLVDLDPYAQDLDSLRRPQGWTVADEVEHEHTHAHDGVEHSHAHSHDDGAHAHAEGDGWSAPVRVALSSARAVFGDPAGLPEADDTGGLVDLRFPAAGGALQASVLTVDGVRRLLVLAWTA